MFIIPQPTRERIMSATLALTLTGLFFSRALLSVGAGTFFLAALVLYGRPRVKNPVVRVFLTGFTLLFFAPVLSGLWSSDTAEWWKRCVVKLPLILLPAAFYYYTPRRNTQFGISILFVFLVLCGTLYSVYEYALGTEQIEAGYLQARVMPVLTANDHIRFSWLTVIAILLIIYLHKEVTRRIFRIINVCIALWLVIFLHILAAKTGLLLLYVSLLVMVVYTAGSTQKKKWLWALLLLPLFPVLAWYTLPTFKKRAQYMWYDFQHYSKSNYREGLSDGMRVVSIKAGVQLWQQQPFNGVGFGDVESETRNWYRQNTPEVQPYEQILPSSQFVIYTAGAGILGIVFFLAGIAWPFTKKTLRQNPYFIAFYVSALTSFIFEIHLESQYGCFIFCFFALWMALCTTYKKDS